MCLDTTLGWDPVSRCALTAPHVSDSIALVGGESSVHVHHLSLHPLILLHQPVKGFQDPWRCFWCWPAEEKQACSGIKGTPDLLH